MWLCGCGGKTGCVQRSQPASLSHFDSSVKGKLKKYAKSCKDFLLKFKRICFGKFLGIKKYGGEDIKMFHKLFIKLKIYV